jgi:hypothetical protein
LAILVLVGIIMLTLMFLQGGVWLGEKALPIFKWLARIACGVVVIILLPMAAFHRTQRFAASGLIYAAALIGMTLWVWGLLLTYNLWGGAAVLLGVCLLGVGVVPMAMLATLFAQMWPTFGQLLLLAALTYGARLFGKKLALKLQREEQKIYELEIV